MVLTVQVVFHAVSICFDVPQHGTAATVQASGAKNGRNGRLVLVDLAGSENVQRSGADEAG